MDLSHQWRPDNKRKRRLKISENEVRNERLPCAQFHFKKSSSTHYLYRQCRGRGRTVRRMDMAFANVFSMLSAYLITCTRRVLTVSAGFELLC